MTIDNNIVETYGGGIYSTLCSNPNFLNVTITNNSAGNNGGGIHCGGNSIPSLLNATIANNSAEINGGGIYCEWDSNINLSNSILNDNSAYNFGGGFYIFESNPEIVHSIIEGNSAYDGGGIYCYTNSNPLILYNRIKNNSAIVSGGGIYCYNGSVSNIINNEFSYNEALVGGGISILDANPSIINNNFNNNEAVEGGGIHISVSSCIMVNNTISNNTAAYQGGGISITYISSPITINTILWENEANISGNEIYIRHNDCEPEFYYCDIQGGLNAFGYEQGVSFNGIYENNLDLDPLFLGSGEDPYSLFMNSPCIDAGTLDLPLGIELPELDISGNPRIYNNNVDIGAYEWQGTPVSDWLEVVSYKLRNYPNPFNPTTTISFSVTQNSDFVTLSVYNIKGQFIKTLVSNNFDKGDHSVIWDGNDELGNSVSSGLYLYKLNINGNTDAIKRCLLLK